MGGVDVDTQNEIKRIWDQRRDDRRSATKDADGRQAIVLAAIEKVEAGVERINGGMIDIDKRVTVIEKVDEERKWSAGGGMVTPGRVAGAGAALGGSGLMWMAMDKMNAILDSLAQLIGQ